MKTRCLAVLLVVFFTEFEACFCDLLPEDVRSEALSQRPIKLFGQYFENNYNRRYDDEEQATEYPPLKEFLEKYTNQNKKFKEQPEKPPTNFKVADQKSKTWDLLHVSQYNHPYDEKKGWVTLDAVPWSISKVSKWQSNQKPQNSWDGIETSNHNDYWVTKPNKPTNTYHNNHGYNHHKPDPRPVRPSFGPAVEEDNKWNSRPYHDDGIITDGKPSDFPRIQEKFNNNYNRRYSASTESLPYTYPSNGDGEWVLLSTTKGYKYPKHRQRSLNLEPDSVSTTRSVHLTVLPPSKDSKINMTTSHGGLLEVESTFQTVEEAQKQHARNERMKQFRPTARPVKNQIEPVQSLVSSVKKKQSSGVDTSAVMAAVGAGMIPATMAMLVPMAMSGRKKRSLRNDFNELHELNIRLHDI